jgi:hypothetical protein
MVEWSKFMPIHARQVVCAGVTDAVVFSWAKEWRVWWYAVRRSFLSVNEVDRYV